MAGSKLHFTDRRGCSIIFDEHRDPKHVADQIIDAHRSPGCIVGRLVRQMRPRDIVGKRDTDSDQTRAWNAGLCQQLTHRALKKLTHRRGLGEMNFLRGARAYLADEIEHDQSHVIAVDIQADGKAAVGIDHELGGGLAARSVRSPRLQNELLLQQADW